MSRFFVSAGQITGDGIFINDKADVNHLKNVLRARIGDEIDVSDSAEWEYTGVVEDLGRDCVRLRITDKRRFAREPSLKATVYQGIPKNTKMEVVVQKCVELGAYRIVPVYCVRTVTGKGAWYGGKLDRLRRVASESVKQCGRGIIPEVGEPLGFREAAEEMAGHELCFFPYENEAGTSIKDFLRGLAVKPGSVAFMIGPEGGFSDHEANMLKSAGCQPVSLGKTVLRTETAAAAALAMLMYELEL